MTESTNFSYIVVDRKQVDSKGNRLVRMFSVWIKNPAVYPSIQTLQSTVPSVVVKLYAGNPYPSFDYTEAVERRVKSDIAENTHFAALIAAQTNGKEWHLTPLMNVE